MAQDTERIIGKLEGISESLQASLDRVLDNQDAARVQLLQHAAEDKANFDLMNAGIGGLRDRIVRVEVAVDTVESHGDALLTLERRMAQQESDAKTRDQVQAGVHANNIRWIGAAGAVGAVAGSAGASTLPKIWMAITSAFK